MTQQPQPESRAPLTEATRAVDAPQGGITRKGLWHGPRVRDPWEMLSTLTSQIEAASDHAAIWVELDE